MKLRTFFSAVEVILELARKELKEQFSRFFLGKWLVILFPLLFIFLLSFLARIVLNAREPDSQLFLFIGFLFWFFFANAVIESVHYVLNQRRVCFSLSRVDITYLPAVKTVTNYAILIAEFTVMGVCLFLKHRGFFFLMNFAVVSMLFFIFTLGISYLLSAAVLFFKDILYVLPYLFMFLFWLTPVMFALEQIDASYAVFYKLNPLTPFFTAIQEGIFSNEPLGRNALFLLLLAILSCSIGIGIFALQRNKLLKIALE